MTYRYPHVYPVLAPEHEQDLKSREVLLIDRHVAEEVLTPEMCLEVLELAFKEEGLGTAVNRTKTNIHLRGGDPDAPYRYCTMEGGISGLGAVGIRIKSDMPIQRKIGGMYREDWYCGFPGRFFGLIMLFSAKDGALLAMLHDAHIHHMRVAATHALATRHLAKENASTLGILGSGGMAWVHAIFLPKVCPIRRIKVYSPTPEHRHAFVRMASEDLGIAVEAMNSAEEVVRGSDIVASCTNTLQPVVLGKWLGKGTHIILCKTDELDEEGWRMLDTLTLYQSPPGIQGTSCDQLFTYTADPELVYRLKGGMSRQEAANLKEWVPGNKVIGLPDLLLGRKSGRDDPRQITCVRTEGTGVQFAAVGFRVYEEARKRGLGRKLPLEWFLQDVTN